MTPEPEKTTEYQKKHHSSIHYFTEEELRFVHVMHKKKKLGLYIYANFGKKNKNRRERWGTIDKFRVLDEIKQLTGGIDEDSYGPI